MRYLALATDYDGTLATHGEVDRATQLALERFVASGRKLIMVTGRQVEDLASVFPRLDLFERVVAENGAVVYTSSTQELRVLEEPPAAAFVDALRARGVEPLSVGHVVVATWEPHRAAVLETIQALGLELHLEFNKGAIMVLPVGLTKRTGFTAALADMRMTPRQVVGIGDAENDYAFLSLCGYAVSVANALPSLKEHTNWVTPADHGAGVVQLIDRMLADDV